MAEGGGDIAWSHGEPLFDKTKSRCRYCGKILSGGATRLKQHLAGGFKDVAKCKNVPHEVQQSICNYLKGKNVKKPGKQVGEGEPRVDTLYGVGSKPRDQQNERPPHFLLIEQNDFSYRKHKKQKEEDIAICNCKYDANDPDSACGERCLNVITSTECTPGFCPCSIHCKNQRFQKCDYAKVKLFKTEGRGWGLMADENIKAGQFIIEYCGEVISSREARQRSQTYETQGEKNAFIISLNANESIDATKKGSLARFINHSCEPNCETRKWTVLGEIRVGIFSKQEIPVGTELAYNYNFQWYGGPKVRCLCGASCCCGFLGANSRGFQEDTYLWENDDARFSVENIPIYDSEEDKPTSKLMKSQHSQFESGSSGKQEYGIAMIEGTLASKVNLESTVLDVEPLDSCPMEVMNDTKEVGKEKKLNLQGTQPTFTSRSASTVSKGKSQQHPNRKKSRKLKKKNVDTKVVTQLLPKEAQEEILSYEERKNKATAELDSVYNKIRPAIEEHERDSQDNVATSVAEEWIGSYCNKMKADFDFFSSIIGNIACAPRRSNETAQIPDETAQHRVAARDNEEE